MAAGVTPQVFESIGDAATWTLEAERLVEQWLAATPRPTGMFVPVDRVTLRVYRHLERRGIAARPGRRHRLLRQRERTAVADAPAPASIDLNRQTIARLAVERLLWRMKNGVTSPRVVITVSPTLVTQRRHGRSSRFSRRTCAWRAQRAAGRWRKQASR